MHPINYRQIYPFHPKLNIERVVSYRSFQQAQDKLFDVSDLDEKSIQFINPWNLIL